METAPERRAVVPRWLRQAVSMSDRPWAVWPALRAMLAAAAFAGVGVAAHALAPVGLMFFGAACAVAFVGSGSHRSRLIALAAQGSGAVAGLGIGAIEAGSSAGRVIVAAAAGLVSGMLGAIGIMATAFALMTVIGVAYAQFGGVALPWYEQAGWYLVGTVVVSAVAILPLPGRRRAYARQAVARVYACAADLLDAVGTPDAVGARRALAAASSTSRDALLDHALPWAHRRRATRLDRQLLGSQQVALAAAALYSEGVRVSPLVVGALRDAVDAVLAGQRIQPPSLDADSPWLRALSDAFEVAAEERAGESAAPVALPGRLESAVRATLEGSAMLAGVRLAWCMALATLLTNAFHQASHSYWLPLTVAVVVRPEYASVFVRTVNRVAGSIVGAILAALALLVLPSGGIVAVAATLFVGWAVVSAPKLYGLSVIGITGSALLSASIGSDDPVYPALRMLDTLAGCAIAIIFGYLLWPGRRTHPFAAHPERAATDAVAYLRQAATAPAERTRWPQIRDQAYASVHAYRAAVQAALADPPPVSTAAAQALPNAVGLEDLVDAISALDGAIRAGGPLPGSAEVDSVAALAVALATGTNDADPHDVVGKVARLADPAA